MSKYHVYQIQNGKTITYGDFYTDNPEEAVKKAYIIMKKNYPQYNRKTPFKVKEYGHEPQEVMYHE